MHIDELVDRLLLDVAEEYECPEPTDETAWHFDDSQIRRLLRRTIEEYYEMIAPTARRLPRRA